MASTCTFSPETKKCLFTGRCRSFCAVRVKNSVLDTVLRTLHSRPKFGTRATQALQEVRSAGPSKISNRTFHRLPEPVPWQCRYISKAREGTHWLSHRPFFYVSVQETVWYLHRKLTSTIVHACFGLPVSSEFTLEFERPFEGYKAIHNSTSGRRTPIGPYNTAALRELAYSVGVCQLTKQSLPLFARLKHRRDYDQLAQSIAHSHAKAASGNAAVDRSLPDEAHDDTGLASISAIMKKSLGTLLGLKTLSQSTQRSQQADSTSTDKSARFEKLQEQTMSQQAKTAELIAAHTERVDSLHHKMVELMATQMERSESLHQKMIERVTTCMSQQTKALQELSVAAAALPQPASYPGPTEAQIGARMQTASR